MGSNFGFPSDNIAGSIPLPLPPCRSSSWTDTRRERAVDTIDMSEHACKQNVARQKELI
ncbi:hypothetical protein J6590_023915 [Homalodisca vitripennis]|nr:hypothetical protein J6590_023915 [Homalodisca vitripennis]